MKNIRFEAALQEIQMIRKERLSEREFYHRIIEAIHKIGCDDILEEDEIIRLQNALKSQGCMTYDEYAAKKKEEGEIVPRNLNLDSGDIPSAVALVGQLLGDPKGVDFAIDYMNNGYQQAYTYRWLQASRRKINVGEYYARKTEDLKAFRTLTDNGETIPII